MVQAALCDITPQTRICLLADVSLDQSTHLKPHHLRGSHTPEPLVFLLCFPGYYISPRFQCPNGELIMTKEECLKAANALNVEWEKRDMGLAAIVVHGNYRQYHAGCVNRPVYHKNLYFAYPSAGNSEVAHMDHSKYGYDICKVPQSHLQSKSCSCQREPVGGAFFWLLFSLLLVISRCCGSELGWIHLA